MTTGTDPTGQPAQRRTGPTPAADTRSFWGGLRRDLRAAVPDAVAALAVTAVVFVLLYVGARSGSSATVEVMPFLTDAETYWMYFLSQAFGWSGLLWAWFTVILGLLLSGPRPRLPVSPRRLEQLHRTTSLNAMVLMFAHALAFAVELVRDGTDPSFVYRAGSAFVDAFVPGGYSSGTGQIAIPIGQAALYLAIPLSLLFYVRHRIGARTWRGLHRFVLLTYVLSVWHTLLYGTTVWFDDWPRTLLWLLQVPIAVLLVLRLTRPARRAERLGTPGGGPRTVTWGVRLVGRVAAVAAVVVLLVVALTGRDGGRERVAPPTGPPEPGLSVSEPVA